MKKENKILAIVLWSLQNSPAFFREELTEMFLFSHPSMGKSRTQALCIFSSEPKQRNVNTAGHWWSELKGPHSLGAPWKIPYVLNLSFKGSSTCVQWMSHTILINSRTWQTFPDYNQGHLDSNTGLCLFWYCLWKWDLVGQVEGGRHGREGQERNRGNKGCETERDHVWQNALCWSLRAKMKIKSWSLPNRKNLVLMMCYDPQGINSGSIGGVALGLELFETQI